MRGKSVIIGGAVTAAAVAALVFALYPSPLPVETARVTRGPLEVAVEQEGRARVRTRYAVAAPVAGFLQRIGLTAGDAVASGAVVARILPAEPPLLDPRARAQLAAQVKAAEAELRQTRATARRARVAREFADKELKRLRALYAREAIAEQALDNARERARVAGQELSAARDAVAAARYRLETARAALLQAKGKGTTGHRVQVRSPVRGRVLRVLEESAGVVPAGRPLLEIGDPGNLEVVADVLTTDAVRIAPGDPVIFTEWGGAGPLHGRVRRVEPSAYTKVSALGVDEQRVDVIVDPADSRRGWPPLSDGYRVQARIVVWRGDDVLQVPAAALFRHGAGWALFLVRGGRARLTPVETGERGDFAAQIESGVAAGELVVSHPSDQLFDGARVEPR